MKILIVFMAILSLNTMFLTYQSDMNRFQREQTRVKHIAEECAAGASLYYDEEAFSLGYLRFNREEGKRFIEKILNENFQEPLKVDYEIEYYEYPEVRNPAVEVTLTVTGKDWFRLGFLTVKEIKRKTYYENQSF